MEASRARSARITSAGNAVARWRVARTFTDVPLLRARHAAADAGDAGQRRGWRARRQYPAVPDRCRIEHAAVRSACSAPRYDRAAHWRQYAEEMGLSALLAHPSEAAGRRAVPLLRQRRRTRR